jgi:hypothetical protein
LSTTWWIWHSGDFEALCALGGGNCERLLEDASVAAVAADPPRILETRVVPPKGRDDAVSTGGRLVRLCGVDGLGEPYRTEILVFESEGELRAIEPVYWSGYRIALSPLVGEDNQPPGC